MKLEGYFPRNRQGTRTRQSTTLPLADIERPAGQMSHPSHPQRFHALDATRAFALLLGVLFHVVWFYVLPPYTSPVTDIRSNALAGWVFTTSHMFRMQLFFVLAGFFAHLIFCQQGLGAFARDRLKRIGLPLLIGWQTIIPALQLVWTWGSQTSGQQDAARSPFAMVASQYESANFLIPAGLGGSFGLGHLWFLHYLLLYYAAVLCGRWLVVKLAGPRSPLHTWTDHRTGFLSRSFWGPILLALVATPLLWIMHGWMAVDLPGGFPVPQLSVLWVYGIFFLFGWLLHRLAHRLADYFLHWKKHLCIGLVASIGLSAAYHQLRSNFLYGLQYPSLTVQDVQNWTAFQTSLVNQASTEPVAPVIKQFWASLPSWTRVRLTRETPLTMDERQGIISALNQVLASTRFLDADLPSRSPIDLRLPTKADMRTNRELLQPYLKGVSPVNSTQAVWYWPLKLVYAICCSLVMCTLVFGCLGAFQALCSGFSPAWRYVADASYWIYLVHLPVLIAFEIPMYRWDVTALVKIPLLLASSLLLLFASYHYLVRSTFIGKLLNGRAYPFRFNPWGAIQAIPDQVALTTPHDREP